MLRSVAVRYYELPRKPGLAIVVLFALLTTLVVRLDGHHMVATNGDGPRSRSVRKDGTNIHLTKKYRDSRLR
jgi:hypothetical protein